MYPVPSAILAVVIEQNALVRLVLPVQIHPHQQSAGPALGCVIQQLRTQITPAVASTHALETTSRLYPSRILLYRDHARDPSRRGAVIGPGRKIRVHHHTALLGLALDLRGHHLLPVRGLRPLRLVLAHVQAPPPRCGARPPADVRPETVILAQLGHLVRPEFTV